MRHLLFCAVAVVSLACSESKEAPPPAKTPPPAKAPPPDAAPVARPAPPDAGPRQPTMEAAMDMLPAAGQPGLVFTSDGKWPPAGPEFALLRVVTGPPTSGDRAAAARKLFAATDLATGAKVDKQQVARMAGMSGFQSLGRGTHEGVAMTVYQVVLFDDAATYVIQGRSSAERWAWYQPTFDKMVKTFQR